jgi:hypothetical protein
MSRRFYRFSLIFIIFILCFMTVQRMYFFLGEGVEYPFGPDPDIWGKAALLARYNAPQTVPPAYPELVSLLSGSQGLVVGALRANILSMFLSVCGCFLGGAWLISNRIASLFLGVSCALIALYTFPVFPSAYYMQPDLMALGMIGMCGSGLVALYRFRTRSSILFCGFWIGMAFSTREHGIVLLVASLILLWWVLRQRAQMLFFLLGVQLGGGLGAGAPHLPFFQPHGGLNGTLTKAQVAVMDTLSLNAKINVVGQSRYEQEAKEAKSAVEFLQNVVGQSVEKSADFHSSLILLVIGSVLICVQRRKGVWVILLIGLSPLFASLVVWTQWRHFFVLLPMMIIFGWGGLGLLLVRWFRGYGGFIVLGYGVFYCATLSPYQESYASHTKRGLLQQQERHKDQIELANSLRTLDDGQSLIMADSTLSILTGMAPIYLQGEEVHSPSPPSYPSFVYWTFVVSKKKMGRRWVLQNRYGSDFVYRSARPEGIEERCLKGVWDGPIVERLPKNAVRLLPRKATGCD